MLYHYMDLFLFNSLQQTRQGNSGGIGRCSLQKMLRKGLLVYELQRCKHNDDKKHKHKSEKIYVSRYTLKTVLQAHSN